MIVSADLLAAQQLKRMLKHDGDWFVFPLPGETDALILEKLSDAELEAKQLEFHTAWQVMRRDLEPVLHLLENVRRQAMNAQAEIAERRASVKRRAYLSTRKKPDAECIYLDQWLEQGQDALDAFDWYSSTGVKLERVSVSVTFISPGGDLETARKYLEARGVSPNAMSGHEFNETYIVKARLLHAAEMKVYATLKARVTEKALVTYGGPGRRQSSLPLSKIFGKKRPT